MNAGHPRSYSQERKHANSIDFTHWKQGIRLGSPTSTAFIRRQRVLSLHSGCHHSVTKIFRDGNSIKVRSHKPHKPFKIHSKPHILEVSLVPRLPRPAFVACSTKSRGRPGQTHHVMRAAADVTFSLIYSLASPRFYVLRSMLAPQGHGIYIYSGEGYVVCGSFCVVRAVTVVASVDVVTGIVYCLWLFWIIQLYYYFCTCFLIE